MITKEMHVSCDQRNEKRVSEETISLMRGTKAYQMTTFR